MSTEAWGQRPIPTGNLDRDAYEAYLYLFVLEQRTIGAGQRKYTVPYATDLHQAVEMPEKLHVTLPVRTHKMLLAQQDELIEVRSFAKYLIEALYGRSEPEAQRANLGHVFARLQVALEEEIKKKLKENPDGE